MGSVFTDCDVQPEERVDDCAPFICCQSRVSVSLSVRQQKLPTRPIRDGGGFSKDLTMVSMDIVGMVALKNLMVVW